MDHRPDPFALDYTPTGCHATPGEDYLTVAVAAGNADGALPAWTSPATMDALRSDALAVPADDEGPARLTDAGFARHALWRERVTAIACNYRRGGSLNPHEES